MIDAKDTALVIEGGGMRNSYTAACIVKLLQEEVEFGWVGGVSAGSSHTVNFLSRDVIRSEESFVDFAKNPSFGGLGSLLRGNGYFNAEYIYEKSADKDMPFDWETFEANPAQMCISAARADTGESVYWGREDVATLDDLMVRVRASSTLPLIMPMRVIDGAPYVDGAMGESGGILIEQAEKAGFEKFLFLGSKPRGYVRPKVSRPTALSRFFRKYPAVAEAMIERPPKYNRSKDRLLELEKEGRAQLFFPEDMQVTSTEHDVAKLRSNFEAGRAQTYAEWPAWREFLTA
ncbi:patatin family protein [Corynebacterium sp. FDAARGOS 1242]|uniref:patatin-like phospholipase family protein n=1 Tax=Corynebacterium sp. FDAARGOS 1242 TaxID=2778078 RepID=UPI00194FC743|nr:patatin family protein [Corynebacterium sp. FDAARGOS 1242]QRP96948.1 patatin family protein [Corynebacterium sp. FDAARGOS 1242]